MGLQLARRTMKNIFQLLGILLVAQSGRCVAYGLAKLGPRRNAFNSALRSELQRESLSACAQAIVKLDEKELERRIQGITAIASDVDGTLLSLDHTLSSKTKCAIERAVKEVAKPDGKIKHFFPATGKSRKGALDSLGPEIRALFSDLPGVFIQGLYCVDRDGSVIFESKLPHQAIVASEALAAKFNTTIIGNYRDEIYCNAAAHPKQFDEVNSLWGEPVPIKLNSLARDGPQFYKMAFMSDAVDMLRDEMRPELEVLAKENGATVTTSCASVLEILPAGCSKALGVQKLCEKLGVDPAKDLLALGDAENDKGMLEMASIGVAMGNGSPVAKRAADIEMMETSSEGGAGLAMERYSRLGSVEAADSST
jgi:Cof subfamily protein (haloacid dehalogenase superfamily)